MTNNKGWRRFKTQIDINETKGKSLTVGNLSSKYSIMRKI